MAVETGKAADRRDNGRADTQRRAVYRRANAIDTGRDARVVNVGPLGLAMRAHECLDIGQSLEIEVFPRDEAVEDSAMTVRGRVIHVTQTAPGEWHTGVRMYVGIQSERPVDARPPDVAQLRDAMARLDSNLARNLVADFEDAAPEPRERERDYRRLGLVLLLLLLTSLGIGWSQWRVVPAMDAPGASEERGHYLLRPDAVVSPEALDERVLAATNPFDLLVVSEVLEGTWRLLNLGESQEALDRYRVLREIGRLSPAEDLVARVGEATALWSLGRAEEAEALLGELGEEPGLNVPEVWHQRAILLAQSMASVEPPVSLPHPEPAVEFAALGGASPASPLVLRVSLSEYALRVEQDGETVAEFPVGLGAADTTPEGRFVISNKIERPDWYDRGRSVAYGDPENPLGDHWIGLAGAGGPNGIGLHATDEPASIGDNVSRGCIRMYPDDVAQLFDLVESGTEVRIEP